MPINKHHNWKYDGGSPNKIPLFVGDRLYGQDLSRDFNYILDKAGLTLKDMFSNFPLKLSGGVVTQGAGDTLDITLGVGYAKYEVDITDDFGVQTPPAVIQQDIEAIRIAWTAQTNLVIPSATLDGATTNYVKVSYNDADLNTRNRKKKTGSYTYELTPSFIITVDSTPSTDYEVLLATFTGSGGGSFTIVSLDPQINFHDNIGIGTSVDTSLTSGPFLAIGDDDTGIGQDGANTLKIFTDGNERVTITSSGNFGIGISTPQRSFTVYEDTAITCFGQFANTVTGSASNNGTVIGVDGTGQAYFYNYGNTDMFLATNNLIRATIKADGRISTGNEAAPDVDPGGLCLNHGSNDGNVLIFKNSDVSHGLGVGADIYAIFKKFNPSYGGLYINGFTESIRAVNILGESTSGSSLLTNAAGASVNIYGSPPGTNNNLLGIGSSSTTMRFFFQADGTAYADVAWSTFSDKRLKKNVKDLSYGLKEILQLDPKKYDKHSGHFDKEGDVILSEEGTYEIGVMAQDVYKVIPEITKKPENEKESFWGIDKGGLVFPLINAVKELNEKIKVLEDKIGVE